jgi:hypothetical protein
MVRTTLAALALTAVLTSAGFAGDCLSCGGGGGKIFGGYGHGHHHATQWNGYCGDGCNTCCDRPCFPILKHTLHKLGRAVDCLIPDPCCRPRGCGYRAPAAGCCEPACGIEPGCGIAEPMMMNDPFSDDHVSPPVPTPMPMKDARLKPQPYSSARPVALPPKPVARPLPKKTAAAPKAGSKPVVSAKSTGKSVLKVAYESEIVESSDDLNDAAPAAPLSIRDLARQEEPARLTAKPVIRMPSTREMPANPLR